LQNKLQKISGLSPVPRAIAILTQAAHPGPCPDLLGAQGQGNHLLMQRIHKLPDIFPRKNLLQQQSIGLHWKAKENPWAMTSSAVVSDLGAVNVGTWHEKKCCKEEKQ